MAKLFALLLLSLFTTLISAKSLVANKDFALPDSSSEETHSFLKVWADHQVTGPRKLPTPPQYMLDLYNSVSDNKSPNPYESKVIRSFTDKVESSHRGGHFSFNISGMGEEESVLEAELHLYIMKTSGLQPHEIRVYQVLDLKKRLIDIRPVGGSNGPVEGWQIFRVKSAVIDLMDETSPSPSGTQLEFWVTAVSANSQPVHLRVSRRRDRHVNHQPVLVLFNDDASSSSSTSSNTISESTLINAELLPSSTEKGTSWRQKREAPSENELTDAGTSRTRHHHRPGSSGECRRQELYVDFESIGWSEWIIAPKGYNAYHCTGTCSFPLGQSQRPTNHATVQSIVHEMRLAGESVGQPCCVPNRLLSLSLLFYDEFDNVVLKQFEEMVADSCGCL